MCLPDLLGVFNIKTSLKSVRNNLKILKIFLGKIFFNQFLVDGEKMQSMRFLNKLGSLLENIFWTSDKIFFLTFLKECNDNTFFAAI
jgi:hypothetical protein